MAGNNNKEWIKNIIFKWDKRIKKVYLNRVESKIESTAGEFVWKNK